MNKLRNIIQIENTQLPEDLQDAQALAGLISHVANESVAMCRSIDPSDNPGGQDSVLGENTGGLINLMNDIKTKRYTRNSNVQQPQPHPQPQVQQPPQSVQEQPQVDHSTITSPAPIYPVKCVAVEERQSNQLELNLNPSTSEQIVNLLDRIESHLSKLCRIAEKYTEQSAAKKVKKQNLSNE